MHRTLPNPAAALRRLVPLALLLCAATALSPALAQGSYPDKPVRIIVPYPPGGTTDLLARAIAPRLEERLKQKFIVENRPGAGGGIGSLAVAKSPADGYTLVMGTLATHAIIPVLQKPAPYDPQKDFAPVTLVAATPNVLVAHPGSGIRTVSDLLAQARARPGAISFGSTSPGGSPHMSGELLKTMARIDLVHVPYKGAAPMLIDLMGGQIPVGFDNLPSSMTHIRSGKVRALAVTSVRRWPAAPDIPTLAESGVPGYESSAWFGLLAPAGTPRAVIDLLQQQVAAILRQPEVEKYFYEQGAEPVGNTPDDYARVIAAELAKWARVVAATGVKME